jgi:hypothetical protein
LGISDVRHDEPTLTQQICNRLIEVRGEDAISSLFNLHLDLCDESQDGSAGKIADCIDLVLPLYISREKIDSAQRQLEAGAGFVWIEGLVATHTGAALVLAGVDRGPTCFVLHNDGPREEHSILFELPAIGHPSIELDVFEVLKHLAKQAGIPFDESGRDIEPKDVAARSRRLGEALSASMRAIKASRKRRTPYCALKLEKISNEREFVKRVLKLVKEYVKPLIFIELSDKSESIGDEIFISRFVISRFNATNKKGNIKS